MNSLTRYLVENLIPLPDEQIKGGVSQGKSPDDIAKHHSTTLDAINKQILKGVEVEKEHTDSEDIAREIAMDHVWEDPKYYDKLSNIENNILPLDLKQGIVYLSKYLIDNGLNIRPLPKVKFIDNDVENANTLLGKTAHYDPSSKCITLYTMNRHVKDILRSFSHELIHHFQNIEGRLNNISTTNTNEDGNLLELEREAYEKGNILLRNWEDSLKNV